MRHRAFHPASLLLLTVLTGCGGEDAPSPAPPPPVAAPAPAPAPAPTPTPAPPALSAVQRLKLAIGSGAPLQTDPVTVTVASGATTSIAGAAVIPADDPRIRILGGRWVRLADPLQTFIMGQATGYAAPGVPRDVPTSERYSINFGYEFVLPGGQNSFEIVTLEAGSPDMMTIRIDGRATNALGYDLQLTSDGSERFIRITLPAAQQARTITIGTPARVFGGLRLPAGNTLGMLPDAANDASVVFEGDSISEGAVSSSWLRSWVGLTAIELGIRNPINIAQGGSGYIAHREGWRPIPQRIDDVLRAVADGPPDAVVVAAGINDCNSYPADDVGAAALDYFRALRAGAPDMVIVVLGPFSGRSDPYPDALATCRDAIFTSARQVSGTYMVDVAGWVTAQNMDLVFGPVDNGPHPVDAGHALYASRAAAAIRAIIAGL